MRERPRLPLGMIDVGLGWQAGGPAVRMEVPCTVCSVTDAVIASFTMPSVRLFLVSACLVVPATFQLHRAAVLGALLHSGWHVM